MTWKTLREKKSKNMTIMNIQLILKSDICWEQCQCEWSTDEQPTHRTQGIGRDKGGYYLQPTTSASSNGSAADQTSELESVNAWAYPQWFCSRSNSRLTDGAFVLSSVVWRHSLLKRGERMSTGIDSLVTSLFMEKIQLRELVNKRACLLKK